MICLLYTSDAADDMQCVDLGGRRIIKKKQISRWRWDESQCRSHSAITIAPGGTSSGSALFFKQKTAYEMQRGLVGSEMCIRDRPKCFSVLLSALDLKSLKGHGFPLENVFPWEVLTTLDVTKRRNVRTCKQVERQVNIQSIRQSDVQVFRCYYSHIINNYSLFTYKHIS